jgi:hypothetical protein
MDHTYRASNGHLMVAWEQDRKGNWIYSTAYHSDECCQEPHDVPDW